MTEHLDTLDHVAIAVDDIDAAVRWYRERFACEVAWQDGTWAMLRFANASLAFVMRDEHPPHLAVQRADAERFGELREHRDGTASVYVRDPSDNAVEVVRPASPGRSPGD